MNSKKHKLNLNSFNLDDANELNAKFHISKIDNDLYNDESDIANKIIRVQISYEPYKQFNVFDNDMLLISIQEADLESNEIKFLQTMKGIQLLIDLVKNSTLTLEVVKHAISCL